MEVGCHTQDKRVLNDFSFLFFLFFSFSLFLLLYSSGDRDEGQMKVAVLVVVVVVIVIGFCLNNKLISQHFLLPFGSVVVVSGKVLDGVLQHVSNLVGTSVGGIDAPSHLQIIFLKYKIDR